MLTYLRVYRHTHIHTYINTDTLILRCIHIYYIHKYTSRHIHTYMQTHIHIYIYVYMQSDLLDRLADIREINFLLQ